MTSGCRRRRWPPSVELAGALSRMLQARRLRGSSTRATMVACSSGARKPRGSPMRRASPLQSSGFAHSAARRRWPPTLQLPLPLPPSLQPSRQVRHCPLPCNPNVTPCTIAHLPLLSCLHTLPACTPCPPSPMLHASVRNFHPLVLFCRSRQGQGRGGGPQARP